MNTEKWYATTVVRREPLLFELENNTEQELSEYQKLDLYKERRKAPQDFPCLDESVLVRHYYRLERLNYSWETGLYPLGSCTMKYNPILNEKLASSEKLAELHPFVSNKKIQGALAITYETQEEIRRLLDLAAVTLQPAAGAHGELTAVFMIKAYFADHEKEREQNNTRRNIILIPESAHGTNPASAAMAGYKTQTIGSRSDGLTDLEDLKEKCNRDVAAFMITNPNTTGIFEKDILEIKKILDKHNILLFMDGANLNAVVGKVSFSAMGVDATQLNLHKTLSTPHGGGGPGQGALGVSERMLPYLPSPHLHKITKDQKDFYEYYTPAKSIGSMKFGYGQFGNIVRTWGFLKTWGNQIHKTSERAVLNANYLREHLRKYLALASEENSLHEVIFSQKTLKKYGLTTMNLAKFLLDYGFYAPTVYFPLHVDGAIMIEPTETESKLEMDRFITTIHKFFEQAKENAEYLKVSPHRTFVCKLDDVLAARKPILTWDMKREQVQ